MKSELLVTNLHFPGNVGTEEDFMNIFLPEKQIILAHTLAVIPDVSPDNTSVTTDSIHLIIWIPVMHNWRMVVKNNNTGLVKVGL